MSGMTFVWNGILPIDETPPEGFHWEYRELEDGAGGNFTDGKGVRHVHFRLQTRQRRAVGPWETK